jgi:malonyl-CoA O-methyltransferase
LTQAPHRVTPAGTSIAHVRQRGTCRVHAATQVAQMRWPAQSRHTAHWLGSAAAIRSKSVAARPGRRLDMARSIYCPPMPASTSSASSRDIDTHALELYLQRVEPVAPWLHGEVARRMGERLSFIRAQPARVIDWWSTRGGSRELLRRAYPKAQLLAVEPTASLREHAQSAVREAWWSPARWGRAASVVHGESDVPEQSAELVWANMMLHWVADPPAAMARWHRALAVDGFVMFSCFGPDTLRELRATYDELDLGPAMPAFVDMHDLGDMMVQAGFADPVMDMERITLTWESAPALLSELRSLGRNVHAARHAGLRTPRWKSALEERLARGGERIPMSFELVYGHAFKPVARARVSPETSVTLADMRAMMRGTSHGR